MPLLASSARPGAAVLGLMAHRTSARPFTQVLPIRAAKALASRMAQAALAGFALQRIEGDAGVEEFVATSGAQTLRFQSAMSVDSWLDHLKPTSLRA